MTYWPNFKIKTKNFSSNILISNLLYSITFLQKLKTFINILYLHSTLVHVSHYMYVIHLQIAPTSKTWKHAIMICSFPRLIEEDWCCKWRSFANAFCWMEIIVFWCSFHWFILHRLIDNKSSLVQVMAWHQTGAKPLPEPMMTQSTHVHNHHQAWTSE